MGKDSIRLLAAIKKRLNFQTQRDRKIQGKINSNSLGNRYSTCYALGCHNEVVTDVKILVYSHL